jgi:hypothetical protein
MIKRATFNFLFILLFASPQPAFASEWYEGGTLHTATVSGWNQSSYKNRLATSADWFVSITKKHNSSLQRKLDRLSKSQYFVSLKAFSAKLENCTSDIAYIKPGEKRVFNSNDKIVEIAFLCYLIMYGSDAD